MNLKFYIDINGYVHAYHPEDQEIEEEYTEECIVIPASIYDNLDFTDIPMVDPRIAVTLEEVKEIKSLTIDLEREKRITAGVTFNGWNFDSDTTSQRNLAGYMAWINAQVNSGVPIESVAGTVWRDADNVDRTLSAQQLLDFGDVMKIHVDAIYGESFTMKNNVIAATTKEEVAAINWAT
jgi:hypothetical protein